MGRVGIWMREDKPAILDIGIKHRKEALDLGGVRLHHYATSCTAWRGLGSQRNQRPHAPQTRRAWWGPAPGPGVWGPGKAQRGQRIGGIPDSAAVIQSDVATASALLALSVMSSG